MRRPPRSTLSSSSAASDVYKRQVYAPVWNTAAIINTFLKPTIQIIRATPQYHRLVSWLQSKAKAVSWCAEQEESLAERAEAAVQLLQSRISELLTFLTVGIAFGAWNPVLLIFLVLAIPIDLFTEHVCTELKRADRAPTKSPIPHESVWKERGRHHDQEDSEESPQAAAKEEEAEGAEAAAEEEAMEAFANTVVALIKVITPASVATLVMMAALCLGVVLVFLDFGFAIGPWVAFWFSLVAYYCFKLWVESRLPPPDDEQSDDESEFKSEANPASIEISMLPPNFESDPSPTVIRVPVGKMKPDVSPDQIDVPPMQPKLKQPPRHMRNCTLVEELPLQEEQQLPAKQQLQSDLRAWKRQKETGALNSEQLSALKHRRVKQYRKTKRDPGAPKEDVSLQPNPLRARARLGKAASAVLNI
eukprot:TRINITY_DN3377_c0_g1_i1.p1 TRINITY_DN3377_c0_g1~~TRINITY_DN3377_c0_g1_i1.p1  ORF type:complete len:419 (-),score=116.95 TRINITY_DN3377_c0_g1_i1:91-1347(-)